MGPRKEDDIAETIAIQRERKLVPPEEVHDLIRKVVVAVINKGHASDLYEFPDVLEYFGAQMPERLVKNRLPDERRRAYILT